MKIKFVLILLICTSINSYGLSCVNNRVDTSYYENGEIRSISKRRVFFHEYYKNGAKKMKVRYDRTWNKGKTVNFDSLGIITSKGKTKFKYRRHGKWNFMKTEKRLTLKFTGLVK